MAILRTPFGQTVPFGRSAEFSATLKNPDRVAYTVGSDLAGAYTYHEFRTREAMNARIYKEDAREPWKTTRFIPVVKCPHNVRGHC